MQDNYVLGTPIFSNESTTEPVLLPEMKTYLHIAAEETFYDALITQLIPTARRQLEDYLNLSLINRTVAARLQNEAGEMQLPYAADTINITSVKDDSGNTIATGNYALKGSLFSGNVSTNAWAGNNYYSPCNSVVNVVYDVSYTELPQHFKTAIMQQVSYLFENRGDDIKTAIAPLVKIGLKPYRRVN